MLTIHQDRYCWNNLLIHEGNQNSSRQISCDTGVFLLYFLSGAIYMYQGCPQSVLCWVFLLFFVVLKCQNIMLTFVFIFLQSFFQMLDTGFIECASIIHNLLFRLDKSCNTLLHPPSTNEVYMSGYFFLKGLYSGIFPLSSFSNNLHTAFSFLTFIHS